MDIALYLLETFTVIILSMVFFALGIRSVLSWLMEEETKFENFIVFITEPFIMPVRALMARFNILQDSPIDFSLMITSVILMLFLFLVV